MGVGGGFILVPAMIYILAYRRCCWHIIIPNYFCDSQCHHLAVVQTQTVDFLLAGLLLLGVIGAQFGSFGAMLRGEQLRGLLALMVLAVSLKLAYDLVAMPVDIFSVEILK